jgi:hypothetical protein
MNGEEKFSDFGKNYYLKHIHLIRGFCFRCTEALTKRDLDSANFYQSRANRIVKGINPFVKYLNEQDRKFLLDTKDRLEKVFSRVASSFQNGEINSVSNLIDEIIVDTLDLEKDVAGISLAQLSKIVLMENNHVNNDRIAKVR